jgi:hypothetical protein
MNKYIKDLVDKISLTESKKDLQMFNNFDPRDFAHDSHHKNRNILFIVNKMGNEVSDKIKFKKEVSLILEELNTGKFKTARPEIKIPIIWIELCELFDSYYEKENKTFRDIWKCYLDLEWHIEKIDSKIVDSFYN